MQDNKEQRENAQRLEQLQAREIDELQIQQGYVEQLYKNSIPDLLARTEKITGISQKELIINAVKATSHQKNMKWYDFLQAFYLFHLRLEEQKGKENANT